MMQLKVLGMIFARLAGNPVDGGKGNGPLAIA
jgi:hypothetical protein